MGSSPITIALMFLAGAGTWAPSSSGHHIRPGPTSCDAASADAIADPFHSARPPVILDDLIGAWDGEGILFGRPTGFVMSWAWELDGRFLGLSYEIRGDTRMSARAHFRIADGNTLQGVWVDSRGEILELEATATDSTFTTSWRSPTERGRTTYHRTGVDTVEVCDFVQDGNSLRLFGSARYARR